MTSTACETEAVRAADRRADRVPSECEAKAKRADEAFGAPGSTAVLEAPRAIPTVRGIALEAFDEFSESINVLIQGLAHEGALKNPGKFGQSNYKAAHGQIHWWLKRRWARLAVITAIETRYAGLGYAGGSAQQEAAAFHAQAQAQGDWREDGAYRQREEETAAPFFGGSVAHKPLWLPASSSVCSLLTLFSESLESSL
jgi:hypothetical protein